MADKGKKTQAPRDDTGEGHKPHASVDMGRRGVLPPLKKLETELSTSTSRSHGAVAARRPAPGSDRKVDKGHRLTKPKTKSKPKLSMGEHTPMQDKGTKEPKADQITAATASSKPLVPRGEGKTSPKKKTQEPRAIGGPEAVAGDEAGLLGRAEGGMDPDLDLAERKDWKLQTGDDVNRKMLVKAREEKLKEASVDLGKDQATGSEVTEAVLRRLDRSLETRGKVEFLEKSSLPSNRSPLPPISDKSTRPETTDKGMAPSSSDQSPQTATSASTAQAACTGGAEPKVTMSTTTLTNEEEEEKKIKREALIANYNNAMADREMIVKKNQVLQNRIAQHMRNRQGEERADYHNKNTFDHEQRYIRMMASMEELLQRYDDIKISYEGQVQTSMEESQLWRCRVEKEKSDFARRKKNVAFSAIHLGTGKRVSQTAIEQFMVADNKKDEEVSNSRLNNIKLKYSKKRMEHALKAKDELAKGLHLIDFEQLKLENQSLNGKIEDRNEELRKLRLKISATVQVLNHLKEKMQYLSEKNAGLFSELHDVDVEVSKKRDTLTQRKKARDSLRIDNQRLRKKSGLLCFEPLLRDYEQMKEGYAELKQHLADLQARHAELVMQCKQMRKKIEQAKASRQKETTPSTSGKPQKKKKQARK